MKTNRISILNQRKVIESRLRKWRGLRDEIKPPSGWISAVRGALGITTRQLAALMGTSAANIRQLEKREARGKATLESVARAAKAMNCKLVYAVVPADEFDTLDAIIDAKATQVAREILAPVEHTMRLEKQGTDSAQSDDDIDQLKEELKSRIDRRIWEGAKTTQEKRRK
jgi:predicted DNA-binding mobile mystery protein A